MATIYEHQLPPENDPEVRALATEWIDRARTAQRPHRALAYAIPGVVVGVLTWGELFGALGMDVHWYLTAFVAIVLGALLGRPARMLGALFDRRWAVLFGALAIAMALLGDLYAGITIAADRNGEPWLDVAGTVLTNELGAWLAQRSPLDWIVSLFAAAAAVWGTRPAFDDRQLVMEARIEIARRRLEAAPAGDPAEDAA